MDEGKKNVLTTNDIRQHARDWTLAGDVGLLAHLEQFSENLCNKTKETQQHLTELTDSYEEVCTKVGNVTNQFLALQNAQFVENRVYDEDTPTEEKSEVKKEPDEAEKERLLLNQYKEAVEVGLKLLDTHFQEVQLPPNSDSDDEDEGSTGNSLIWKPKNPYAGKKFPLLIGSSSWWADDNVGLGNVEENLDTEKTISDSESDFESPQVLDKKMESSSSSIENEEIIPTKPTFMDSSSEDLFGLQREENYENDTSDIFGKSKNSILGEPKLFSPLFENQEEIKKVNVDASVGKIQVPEEESISSEDNQNHKPQKMNNDFTRELMAKLGTKKNVDTEDKKPKEQRPVIKPKEKIPNDSLFDETDDSSELFSENIKQKPVKNTNLFFDGENDDQLFSGSNNLFIEPADAFENDIKKPENKLVKPINDTVSVQKKESPVIKKPLVNSLFEDIDDEDTLFSSKPVMNNQKIESLPSIDKNSFKKIEPVMEKGLFDDFNETFEDDLLKPKLFDSKISKDLDISNDSKNKENKPDTDEIIARKTKLDDSKHQISNKIEPKHSENAFNIPPTDKKISFIETEDDQDDLFSSSFKEDSLFKGDKKISSAAKGLPAVEDDDISLFADKPKQPDSVSISSSRSSLFDDVSATKSKLASVFEKDKTSNLEDDLFNVSDNSLFGAETTTKAKDLFSSKSATKTLEKGKSSLFDDFDDSDDLFGPTVSQTKLEKPQNKEITEKKPPVSLFGEDIKISKSIFLDDVDDDDLFKTSGDIKPSKSENKKAEIPKETKSDLFEDVPAKPESKIFSDLDDAELFMGDKAESINKPMPVNKVEPVKPKVSNRLGDARNSNQEPAKPKISSALDSKLFVDNKSKPGALDDDELFTGDYVKPLKSKVSSALDDAESIGTAKIVKAKIPKALDEDELFTGGAKPVKSKVSSALGNAESVDKVKISNELEEGDLFTGGAKPKPKISSMVDDAESIGTSKIVKANISKELEEDELFTGGAKPVKLSVSSELDDAGLFSNDVVKPDKPLHKADLFAGDDNSVKPKISSKLEDPKIDKTEPQPKIFNELDDNELFAGDKVEPAKTKLSSGLDDAELFGSDKNVSLKSNNSRSSELFGNNKPDEMEDADLFGGNNIVKSKIPTGLTDAELFGGNMSKDDELFAGHKSKDTKPKLSSRLDNAEFADKSELKPKPPNSLNLKSEEIKPVKSVGKLNIPDNLKFKFESMAKNISSGEVRPKEEKKIDISDSFEPPSNLLKCPSKDRVKIPVKRRPQSRRARQEAIRNSGVNFGVDVKDEKSNSKSETTISKEPPKDPLFFSPVPSNPLSPSTDEEDYFNVPELDTNFEKEDQSIFENNLFQSSNNSKTEDLLFDKPPVLSPLSSKKNPERTKENNSTAPQTKPTVKKVSIFDDDEEDFGNDDSLFKTQEPSPKTVKETPKVKNLFQNQTSSSSDKTKKSLFGEDFDDEDDLFGGSSKSTPVVVPKQKITKNDEKSGKLKEKEKENPGFIDPLGLMSSDD